jgi:hypothetical protein
MRRREGERERERERRRERERESGSGTWNKSGHASKTKFCRFVVERRQEVAAVQFVHTLTRGHYIADLQSY